MGVLKKRDASIVAGIPEAQLSGGSFQAQYPSVWEHLASLHYDDGTPRLPSTLTLFVDAGAVKACLNDRDQGVTGWAAGDSVSTCLMALERALQADTVDWRAAKANKGKKR